MGGIVNIMGLPVNIMTEKEYTGLMKSYVSNDNMNIMYMVSAETFQALSVNEKLLEGMKEADLILPAERDLLSSIHGYKVKGIVNSYKYLLYLLRKESIFKKVYIIGNNDKNVEQLKELILRQNEELNICGSYSVDAGASDETIINDINSNEPDLLLITIDSPMLEQWITEHRFKVFAKVCVGLGNITDKMIKENNSPPKWMLATGLDNIYFDIKEKKYFENRKKTRIMQALLAEYNNRDAK